MGKSANSAGGSGDGDGESKVHVAVIGVGVGLAAGFAAPLMAGVALSAIGFTSAGMHQSPYSELATAMRKELPLSLCWFSDKQE